MFPDFHLAIVTVMEIATVIVVHQIVTAIANVTVTVAQVFDKLKRK